jgi:predicted peroxiredoxin
MMTPPPNERDKETENAINEYLKKGGKITVCDEGARTENIDYKGSSFYGRKPKKKDSK